MRPGLRISQARAEAWLLDDLAHAEASVDRLLQGVTLSPRQRDALVSFCFNVGAGALGGSTLRRRLLAGEPAAKVVVAELLRWCKGPTGPIVGLQRRRAAEIAHSAEPDGSVTASTATTTAGQAASSGLIELQVPYDSQNDSATGQGSRMCFSSSCAMAAAFLRPGCLQSTSGSQVDDRYLQLAAWRGWASPPASITMAPSSS